MAVQFSTALLLEVGWRESILSETLLQMMPPPIVMASRELHELHEGGAMLEEASLKVSEVRVAQPACSRFESGPDITHTR